MENYSLLTAQDTCLLPHPVMFPGEQLTSVSGRIHSWETAGTVDGPGLRFVLFTQGCHLACVYCHNIDSKNRQAGRTMTAAEVVHEVLKYRSFIGDPEHGGFTISGGEPLVQPHFTAEILRLCQQAGLHTALDTSGFCAISRALPMLEYSDLVLLDIKAFEAELFRRITGAPISPTLRFAEHLAATGKPTWIRFVLVPGLTDDRRMINNLAAYARDLGNVERVEVQPFHQMGAYKWQRSGRDYQLQDTPPCPAGLAVEVREIFAAQGLEVQ